MLVAFTSKFAVPVASVEPEIMPVAGSRLKLPGNPVAVIVEASCTGIL